MSETKWKVLDHKCDSRTYIYPDGSEYTVKDVILYAVSDSGTHYLETEDFGRYIVSPGWRAIRLEMNDWTYPGPSSPARSEYEKVHAADPGR